MPTKILKRLNEPARVAHFLLKELLYSMGWTDVENSDSAIFDTYGATGSDGETNSAQPTRFISVGSLFITGLVPVVVGDWITLYNSEFVNNGVYQVAGVASETELVLTGGLYGASLVDDLNVSFRVYDPATLNAVGTNYYVMNGKSGTSAPLWQVKLGVGVGVDTTINIEVAPQAGRLAGAWTLPVLTTQSIVEDATPTWYLLIDDTHVRMWTQNAAGTAVYRMAYFGAAESHRPSDDGHFVVSCAGESVLATGKALADIQCLSDDYTTNVSYSALTYGDSVDANMFTSLPANQFDLRNDSAKIPIGTNVVGFEEDERGYLRGLRYISDQIAYKSFVDNGRLILSLGGGLAIEWDGSLPR